MVVATVSLFLAALALRALLFSAFEFVPITNWIYLPAGVRLLCMLLFGEAGALSLLIVSGLVSLHYFFPEDFERAFMAGILATAAPYLVYRLAHRLFGLQMVWAPPSYR